AKHVDPPMPWTLRMRPEDFSKFLGARFAVDLRAFGSLKPVFGPEKRIQVECQTGVDPRRLDVDGPEDVGLPADVQPDECDDRQVVRLIRRFTECPEAVLAIDHLNGVQSFWRPARAEGGWKDDVGAAVL